MASPTVTFFDQRTEQTVTVQGVPNGEGTIVPVLTFGQAAWHAHKKPGTDPYEAEVRSRRQPLVLDRVLATRWPKGDTIQQTPLFSLLHTLAEDPKTDAATRVYTRDLIDRMTRVSYILEGIRYPLPEKKKEDDDEDDDKRNAYEVYMLGLTLGQFRTLLDELRCVVATPRKRMGEGYESILSFEDSTAISYFERDDAYLAETERMRSGYGSQVDCAGRELHTSSLRMAVAVRRSQLTGEAIRVVRRRILDDPSYAGKRDPVNNDGICRDYFVCCGQSLDHPGCLIDTYSPSTNQSMPTVLGGSKFRPYAIIEQLLAAGTDELVLLETIARRWTATYRRGTAFLNREPYDVLDRKIRALLPIVAGNVAAGYVAVYERPPRASAWFESMGADMLNRLVQIYSLINEYNAYRCHASGFVPPRTPFEWIRFFEINVIKPEMAYDAGLNRPADPTRPFPGYVQRGSGAPGTHPVLDSHVTPKVFAVFNDAVFSAIRRTPLYARALGQPQLPQLPQRRQGPVLEDMTLDALRATLAEREQEYQAAEAQATIVREAARAVAMERNRLNEALFQAKVELARLENLPVKDDVVNARIAEQIVFVDEQNRLFDEATLRLDDVLNQRLLAGNAAAAALDAVNEARLAVAARAALDDENVQLLLDAQRVKREDDARRAEEEDRMRIEEERLEAARRAKEEEDEAARQAFLKKEGAELAERKRQRDQARAVADARDKALREAATPKVLVKPGPVSPTPGSLATPPPTPPFVTPGGTFARPFSRGGDEDKPSPSTPIRVKPSPQQQPPGSKGKEEEEDDDTSPAMVPQPLPSPAKREPLLSGGRLRPDARENLERLRQLLNRLDHADDARIVDVATGQMTQLWNPEGTQFAFDVFNRNCVDYITSVFFGRYELTPSPADPVDPRVGASFAGMTPAQYNLLFFGAGRGAAGSNLLQAIPAVQARIVQDGARNATATRNVPQGYLTRFVPAFVCEWAEGRNLKNDIADGVTLTIPSPDAEKLAKNIKVAGLFWANFITMLLEITSENLYQLAIPADLYAASPKLLQAAQAIQEALESTDKPGSFYRRFQLFTIAANDSGGKFDSIQIIEGEHMNPYEEDQGEGAANALIGAEYRPKSLAEAAATLSRVETMPFYTVYDTDANGKTVPASLNLDEEVNRTLLRPVLEAYARAVEKVGGQDAFAKIVPIDTQKDLGLLKVMKGIVVPATSKGEPPQEASELKPVTGLTSSNRLRTTGIGHLSLQQQIDLLHRWGKLATILDAILSDGVVTTADVAALSAQQAVAAQTPVAAVVEQKRKTSSLLPAAVSDWLEWK